MRVEAQTTDGKKRMVRIPQAMRDALNESHLPWKIVVGAKHMVVFVNDVQVAVYSKGSRKDQGRQCFFRANLKRILRQELPTPPQESPNESQ